MEKTLREFTLTGVKPDPKHVSAVKRLKDWEEESKQSRHIIYREPPSANAPLDELRRYAATHGGGNAAYCLQRRQLVRFLGL